jgi:HPt (histidine-containing phosphotransfer) domain-containing protein
MPVMDGFAATAAIREREGAQRHTPIIALTASALDEERERCRAAGMDDYLAKPISREQLAAAMNHWLPPPGEAAPTAPAATKPAAPARGAPILDQMALAQILGVPVAQAHPVLATLIELFRRESPARYAVLQATLRQGDQAAVLAAAHSLRGMSATLGLRAMAAYCGQIERRAESGKLGSSTQTLAALERLYRASMRALGELADVTGAG